VLEERGHVGREERLALAEADAQRRRDLRGDDLAGCFSDTTASAYAPSTCAKAVRTAATSVGAPGQQRLVDQVRRDLGVGLRRELAARRLQRARSARWFSMMRLCTTATEPVLCGWALISDGRPWVAQRVWPTPTLPGGGSFSRPCLQPDSLPRQRTTCMRPPSLTARPAES
jgi:hypothetical protein